MAAVAAARPLPAAALARAALAGLRRRPNLRWATPAFSASAAAPSPSARKLVLYSKPGCCLCDGLKEKLHAAFSSAGPRSLNDVELQVRNILDNPEWERLYQYEIPVLARVLPDGSEEVLPRLSPRSGVELIQKKLVVAFSQS